jgi:hypothetical protein
VQIIIIGIDFAIKAQYKKRERLKGSTKLVVILAFQYTLTMAREQRHRAVHGHRGVTDQKRINQATRGSHVRNVCREPVADRAYKKIGHASHTRLHVTVEPRIHLLQYGKECQFHGAFNDHAFFAHGIA